MVSPGKMREKKGGKIRKPKEPELPQEYVPPPLPLPGDDFAMVNTSGARFEVCLFAEVARSAGTAHLTCKLS